MDISKIKRADVCRCNAYNFPHRLGSGKCKNTSLEAPFCSSCGKHCAVFEEDVGEGAFEFWGQSGVDVQIVELSACCGSDVEAEQRRSYKRD